MRQTDDLTLDFGTSGRLYQSSLVMYDRQIRGESELLAIPLDELRGERVGRSGQSPTRSGTNQICRRKSPNICSFLSGLVYTVGHGGN